MWTHDRNLVGGSEQFLKQALNILNVRWKLFSDLGASVITLKPAIRYQFKTGQRDWPKTSLFYLATGCICKA
jgi:hypothetical protein